MNNNTEIIEDEIDLKELFNTIYKNKFKIILLTFIVTLLTVLYTLSIPNSYKSQTMLIPQTQAKQSLGGLGALAGMAGIDLGGSGSLSPAIAAETILKDYSFEKYMIEKYNLYEKFIPKQNNLVFAFSYNGIYNLLHKESVNNLREDEKTYNTYKNILSTISISSDKKSGIITLSAESTDRFLTKELVEIYLIELTSELRRLDMESVEQQLEFYNNELANILDISIKNQLGELITQLVQKKVLSKANKYYNMKQLTKPQVSYVKEKTKPKRSLITIVSFITSIILGIFLVFFLRIYKKR